MGGAPAETGVPGALARLLLAKSLSQLGFRILALALPIVAVVMLDASPFMVSVVSASQTVAFLLIGLPAGALVDRASRRTVLIISDFGRATALLSIPIAWWLDVLSIVQLCVVAFVVGVLTVFFDVADQSYLPEVVGRDKIVKANSRLVMVDQMTGITGPGIGGLLIQAVGAPVALIATCFGYVWSGALIMNIKNRAKRISHRAKAVLAKDVMEGLRYVIADPLLRPIVFCSTTQTLSWSIGYLMLLVLLADDLAIAPAHIGLLFTVGSLGGVLATFLVNPLIKRLGDGRALRLGVTVGGLFTLFAALTQPGWRLWFASVASFGIGFGLVLYNVAQVSFRQRRVPTRLLGRVNATVRFFAWGARPIGGVLGGILAQMLTVRTAVLIGAIGTSLAAVWLYRSPLRRLRVLPTEINEYPPPVTPPVVTVPMPTSERKG